MGVVVEHVVGLIGGTDDEYRFEMKVTLSMLDVLQVVDVRSLDATKPIVDAMHAHALAHFVTQEEFETTFEMEEFVQLAEVTVDRRYLARGKFRRLPIRTKLKRPKANWNF